MKKLIWGEFFLDGFGGRCVLTGRVVKVVEVVGSDRSGGGLKSPKRARSIRMRVDKEHGLGVRRHITRNLTRSRDSRDLIWAMDIFFWKSISPFWA